MTPNTLPFDLPAGARPGESGFTLIELMMVVAIIGILAALSIPSFMRFQMRARSAEGKTNLAAIVKAEHGYFAEFGTYLAVPAAVPLPAPVPGRSDWVLGTAFDVLGWAPEGPVYFVYAVAADNNGGPGAALVRFTAEAASDIDGDGLVNYWGYVKPVTGATVGLPGPMPGSTCAGTGTYDTVSMLADLLETVGPCDAISGTSEY